MTGGDDDGGWSLVARWHHVMLLRAGLMLDGEASRATTADGRLLFPAMELLACLLACFAGLAG